MQKRHTWIKPHAPGNVGQLHWRNAHERRSKDSSVFSLVTGSVLSFVGLGPFLLILLQEQSIHK